MARRLGLDYVHPQTVFSQKNAGTFFIRINTALGKANTAVTAADCVDISRSPAPTLALIDVAPLELKVIERVGQYSRHYGNLGAGASRH